LTLVGKAHDLRVSPKSAFGWKKRSDAGNQKIRASSCAMFG